MGNPADRPADYWIGRPERRGSDGEGEMKGRAARIVPLARRRRWRLPRRLRRPLLWGAPLIIAAGAVMVARSSVGSVLLERATERAIAATAALGLVVTDIDVQGRETTDQATILAALAANRGTPILAVSPSRAKLRLEALPWVRSAAIERRLPGTLFVRLVERRPLALWQHDRKQQLIDREGAVIPVTDLGRFAGLPLVVGDDAAAHAAPLLEILAREPELAARVTAAVRVDHRRWNLRIDNAIEVLLPEENPAAAWTRLAQLERANSLLKREVQTVDMRLPDRLVLRVTTAPASEPIPPRRPHQNGKNT
jgi:cell division protein FtsQ